MLDQWACIVESLDGGKRIGDARYLHLSAVSDALAILLRDVAARAGCASEAFNIVKVGLARPRISLLHYPGFFDEGFPVLAESWTIDLGSGEIDHRLFEADANPPVLHRKELMLADDHPRRAEFEALTAAAETHGLFADPAIIGHLAQWEEELRARGVRVEGHSLVAGEVKPALEAAPHVLRHRTALARRALSTPMQALWRHGYLTGASTVLDYGCGRGDDLASLQGQGINAVGWDPYFRPEGERIEADVVNLGFVLNVIENVSERREALRLAYGYARCVLAIAALIGGRTAFERYRLFRDGVLTKRGTFQKYYTHEELGAYIAEVVGREPVAVGPGLYFVFRTDADEQEFLERRQRSHVRPPPPITRTVRPAAPRARPAPPERPPRAARQPPPTKASHWATYGNVIDGFWKTALELGRLPREGEFNWSPELSQHVGSPGLVLRRLIERHGEQVFEAARARRKSDLTVFFALNLFEQRRSSTTLNDRTRIDIREFWRSHSCAIEDARALLFSLRNTQTINEACTAAASQGLGYLVPCEALYLDGRLTNELSPALRVYVGCASKLYGEAQGAELVKIHIHSGKVSFMTYDDYEGSAIPMLIERVKVDLRRQQVHYFQYGDDFPAQPLYCKSRYMLPDCDGYDAQQAFDEQLLGLTQFDWTGFGPPLAEVLPLLPTLTISPELQLPTALRPLSQCEDLVSQPSSEGS